MLWVLIRSWVASNEYPVLLYMLSWKNKKNINIFYGKKVTVLKKIPAVIESDATIAPPDVNPPVYLK